MPALQKLSAAAQASLRALTNLWHLEAKLPLTPDLLTALQPLHALTQLQLASCRRADDQSALNHVVALSMVMEARCLTMVTSIVVASGDSMALVSIVAQTVPAEVPAICLSCCVTYRVNPAMKHSGIGTHNKVMLRGAVCAAHVKVLCVP